MRASLRALTIAALAAMVVVICGFGPTASQGPGPRPGVGHHCYRRAGL